MSVEEVLASIVSRTVEFSGAFGVWARALTTGETVEWNAREVFPSASAIKLPILYEVFRQAGEGRIRLTDTRVVRGEDVVPGSGILKDLTPGLELSLRDLAVLMIVLSDNTASNALIDVVGIDAVNQSMRSLGLEHTVLEHKFFRAPPGAPINRSSPADLGRLMLLIATHEVLTAEACEVMLEILRRQHHTDLTTRRIADFDGFVDQGTEPAVRVASKSGSIRGTRNDVALVERDGLRYVIAMMSRDSRDRRFYADNEAAVLLADVSGLLYEHFCRRAGIRLSPGRP
jgi:beta-lactamase class A